MSQQEQTNSRKDGRRHRLILAVVALVVVVTIGYLVAVVRGELESLSRANSDNVQWNMSQAEVEFLAFLVEAQRANSADDPDLFELRKRFDVLYSRISTLESGALYVVFRNEPEAAEHLAVLRGFLDDVAIEIDSRDAELKRSLPAIIDRTVEVRPHVRDIALQGIDYFSQVRDQRRQSVYRTLIGIAFLTSGLLLSLFVLVIILNKLNTVNRNRSVQNDLARSRMSAILTTSLDAIIAIDRTGEIIDFSGAAEEVFGYSREEAIGSLMADLIIPDHLRAAHDAGMRRYLETGEKHVVDSGRVRLEGKRKNGEVFPVEFSIATAMGAESEIFVSYLRDISKEVESENELRKARDSAIAGEKSKSQLLAVMSHEMRTPLNGLLGTMELLADTDVSDKQKRYLRIMNKSGNLLLSHVNDVLDISRLEAGKMDIDSTVFDLNALVLDLIEGHRPLAHESGNTIHFAPIEVGQLLVNGDQLRIRQVLLNLIGNAIKFTRNGDITIETERLPSKDLVEIRVSDTGIGISEDNIERVFEDFTTLDSSYSRRAQGTGLGLGISRRITKAMGGDIGVESEKGEGSLFWIRLPIAIEDDIAPSRAASELMPVGQGDADVNRKSIDILLVEDNEINRMVARDFLEADDHRVSEAHDGAEGVAFAERQRFDLILMDISMPEMDGLEATREIRSGNGLSRDTPIVALTAHALEEDIRRFVEAGMDDVISKPVSRTAFRQTIASIAGQKCAAPSTGRLSAGPVDLAVFSDFRADLGEERFRRIFEKFTLEMNEATTHLNAAGANPARTTGLAETAHRLSGSAAMFGARDLRQALAELEIAAKGAPEEAHHSLVERVVSVWEVTRSALDSNL